MSATSSIHRALFGPQPGRVADAEALAAIPGRAGAVWDAIVWDEATAGVLDTSAAGRLRAALGERGRLAVHRPLEASRSRLPQLQSLVVALSEAGFVILDEDAGAGLDSVGVWVVARRARFSIRGYRNGDETQIGELFAASFHTERSAAAWRWKFRQHPWGNAAIALAWDEQDAERPRLVGQYAAIPMRLAGVAGEDDRALQLCDIMTAPEARAVGRGPTAVLSRMLRRLYSTHGEHRIGFVIGWNTATSRAFARRFHAAHEHGPVACWHRDRSPPAVGGGYRIREIESFGPRFDRFFRRVLPAYGYLQRRDAAYLAWRYRQPGVRYLRLAAYRFGRLAGWAIFRRQDERLVWGDALVDPRQQRAADALLAAALEHAETRGAERVTAWFGERPAWWCQALAGLGFARQREPSDLSLIYGVHSLPDAGRRLAHLYYTMGDSDLF